MVSCGIPLILPVNSCVLPTGDISGETNSKNLTNFQIVYFGEKIFNTISLGYALGMMTIGMFNGNVYLANGFCLLYSYIYSNTVRLNCTIELYSLKAVNTKLEKCYVFCYNYSEMH